MKIGILTFHKAYNYGAFMQAYSLQKALSNRFPNYTFEIIDFVPFHEVYRYWIKVPIWIILHQGIKAAIFQYKKYNSFSHAMCAMNLGKNAGFSRGALYRRLKDYNYIIVGSDAVFNDIDLTGISGVSPFFLENVSIPKSSYAASAHGLDYTSFDDKKKLRIHNALDSFQILSVRDSHTARFVLSMLDNSDDKRVVHGCDPTVLLSSFPEDESIINSINDYHKSGKKVIALMLKTEKYSSIIKKCEDDNCIYISLANFNHIADIQLLNISPFSWATCLKYVDYTVTDYFHGTLVSLRLGKPVISIDISKELNGNKTKIGDLLVDRLDLKEFYFPKEYFENPDNLNKIKEQCIKNSTIDYSEKISSGLLNEKLSFDCFCDALAKGFQ